MNDNLIDKLKVLLNRLDITSNGVVMLNLGPSVKKGQIKDIIDFLLEYLYEGTLCILGDCEFNTSQSDLKSLSKLEDAKRNLIYTSIPIKLMALYEDVHYMNHPSLEIAVKGKHASQLTNHKSLDFPYGEKSIFSNLYELDASLISIGEYTNPYPLKYGISDNGIILKNNCVYKEKIYSYLDFDFDYEKAFKIFEGEILYEESDSIIYGEKYPYLIDKIKKQYK